MSSIENKDYLEEPDFSEAEKNLYQAAYRKIQEKIDVSFYDPNKSFSEIEKKLGLNYKDLGQKKKLGFKKPVVTYQEARVWVLGSKHHQLA